MLFPKKFLKTILFLSLTVLVASCGVKQSEGDEEKYTFHGTTGVEETDLISQSFFEFQEKIKENSDGRIELEYDGGPESVPADEIGDAIQNGAIDFVVAPAAYYADQFPEGLALSYSEIDTEEELKREAFDYLDDIYQEKMNSKFLGRGADVRFGLYTKEKLDSIDDFKGMRIRGTPTYDPMIKKLGAETVSLPGGEIYEGLDKGVIDGFGYTAVGVTNMGVEDVIGAKLSEDSEYYRMDVAHVMNLDAWDELPDDLKDIMIETQREVEEELPNITESYREEEESKLEEADIEEMDLGDEFQDKVHEAGWEFIQDNIESSDDLEELFRE